jgi:hypothetical protein
MTEIKLEHRPKRSMLPVILAILIVAALAVVVYFYLDRGGLADDPGAPVQPAGDTAVIGAVR